MHGRAATIYERVSFKTKVQFFTRRTFRALKRFCYHSCQPGAGDFLAPPTPPLPLPKRHSGPTQRASPGHPVTRALLLSLRDSSLRDSSPLAPFAALRAVGSRSPRLPFFETARLSWLTWWPAGRVCGLVFFLAGKRGQAALLDFFSPLFLLPSP